jgi:hypothetical protein
MSETYYYKLVADLSLTELLQLYDCLDNKHLPAHYPISDKKSVILNIFKLDPDFFTNDPKFVFKKNQKGEIKYLKDHTEPCEQKFARKHQKVNLDKILALLKASSIAEVLAQQSDVEQSDLDSEQESDDGDDLNETVRQAGPNIKKNKDSSKPQQSKSQKRKTPNSSPKSTDDDTIRKSDYRVKAPKYYSSMPIETWLRNMEIFGKCSNIEDSKLITVAISNLLSGDAGANIIESLDDDEMVDWNLFKRNLISSLGQSDEFYKNQFHKYQRGSDSFGLCMANLKAYFKKGYKKTYLNDDNREAILERFINCQNPKIKEILKREKSLLTIENAAKRATEIEISIPTSENIFMAEATHAESPAILELCSLLKDQIKRSEAASAPKARHTPKSQSRVDSKKLQGHCIAFVKRQKCKKNDSCKYLHSDDPPKSVVDYIKSL